MRNFQDTQALGKFLRHPGTWEISKIFKKPPPSDSNRNLGNLGNFKFPKYPGIWEISQIPKYLVYF